MSERSDGAVVLPGALHAVAVRVEELADHVALLRGDAAQGADATNAGFRRLDAENDGLYERVAALSAAMDELRAAHTSSQREKLHAADIRGLRGMRRKLGELSREVDALRQRLYLELAYPMIVLSADGAKTGYRAIRDVPGHIEAVPESLPEELPESLPEELAELRTELCETKGRELALAQARAMLEAQLRTSRENFQQLDAEVRRAHRVLDAAGVSEGGRVADRADALRVMLQSSTSLSMQEKESQRLKIKSLSAELDLLRAQATQPADLGPALLRATVERDAARRALDEAKLAAELTEAGLRDSAAKMWTERDEWRDLAESRRDELEQLKLSSADLRQQLRLRNEDLEVARAALRSAEVEPAQLRADLLSLNEELKTRTREFAICAELADEWQGKYEDACQRRDCLEIERDAAVVRERAKEAERLRADAALRLATAARYAWKRTAQRWCSQALGGSVDVDDSEPSVSDEVEAVARAAEKSDMNRYKVWVSDCDFPAGVLLGFELLAETADAAEEVTRAVAGADMRAVRVEELLGGEMAISRVNEIEARLAALEAAFAPASRRLPTNRDVPDGRAHAVACERGAEVCVALRGGA
jgi:hypothetical protein